MADDLAARILNAIDENAAALDELEPREWISPCWTFARRCKGFPELAGKNALAALTDLVAAVPDLWDRLGADALKGDGQDFAEDFLASWGKILCPAGDQIDIALELAKSNPVTLPAGLSGLSRFKLFLGVAYHTQAANPERPIILPVGPLAKALDCSIASVSRASRIAIELGLISRTKAGRYKEHQANEFCVHLDRMKLEVSEVLPEQGQG